MELFDQKEVFQRGYFYCTSGGTKSEKSCKFRAPFTFDFKSREYIFKAKGLYSQHNHVSTPFVVDGVLYRRKENELTAEEVSEILEISPFVTLGQMRRILRNRWPNIGFDSALLSRLKSKGKMIAFGADKDAINIFIQKGTEIISKSGIFDIRFD